MASAPSTHLVLFIAAVIVAASLAGTVTQGATRLGSALGAQSRQQADAIDAEVEIVSDAGSPASVYDHDTDTLTLYVKNVGGGTLPADPDLVSVLVNGEYRTDVETTVLDGEAWAEGNLLRVRVDVPLRPLADTRVVVTPTGARDTFRFRTPPKDGTRGELVFATRSGELRSVTATGGVTRYDATAAAVGPKEVDFDGDAREEIPYVDANGALKLVDDAGEATTLVDDGVETNGTLLGVGEWRGATSVYYVNASDNSAIYRVRPGSSPSRVTVGGSAQSADAAAGVGDVNGDGDTDLVFVGTSQGLYYVDGDSATSMGGVGKSTGVGVGAPRAFDGTPLRVPGVDGSGNLALWAADSTKTTWTSSGGYPKGPAAGFDADDDHAYEIAFVENGDIHYVEPDGTVRTVAENVDASEDTGVA